VSLVEVLVAIAIAGIIIGPLAAWSVGTLRHQGTARDELGRATATGLLNTYYLRDVASARFVSVPGQTTPAPDLADCAELDPAAPSASSSGRVVLTIISAGDVPERIVYVEKAAPDGPTALWRRECPTSGPAAVLSSETEVFRDVEPGTTRAGCPTPDGVDCAGQRSVTMVVRPLTADGTPAEPLTIAALRRTDAASDGLGAAAQQPVARATATPVQGYRSTVFELDAGLSLPSSPGGQLAYAWTLPPDAWLVAGTLTSGRISVAFNQSAPVGERTMFLSVTDDDGGVSQAWVTVVVAGRFPTARATVTADPAVPRRFLLDATASSDPEDPSGGTLTFDWALPDGQTRTGATTDWVAPDGLVGPQIVTLRVTDTDGSSDTTVSQIELGGQVVFPGGVVIEPTPVGVGGPRPPLVGTVGPGPLTVTFRTPPTEPPPPGSTTSWRVFPAATATSFDVAGDPGSFTFQPADAGSYEVSRVTLTAAGDEVLGPRVPFRINRAPEATASVASSAGTVPRTVSYSSAGSRDPDGVLVSYLWNFGDGGTSSDPNPTYTFGTAGTFTVTLTVTDDDGGSTTVALPPVVVAP
jgi:chitodextrinase